MSFTIYIFIPLCLVNGLVECVLPVPKGHKLVYGLVGKTSGTDLRSVPDQSPFVILC